MKRNSTQTKPWALCIVLGTLLVASIFLHEEEKECHKTSQFEAKLLSPTETENQHLNAYTRLMAPIAFPQLYPSCGRVVHPDLPSNLTESKKTLSRSQNGEDLVLFDLLFHKDTEPGTFLEIGALDGVKFSNTYFFEHALGWKGILVEANPANAAKLRKANRPRSARFSVGICGIDADLRHPGNLTFSTTGGPVATAVDYAAPGFLKTWKGRLGEDRVVVPCIPLQVIIDATGLLDIDFFSLDVEGAEKLVLQTVDLSKTNIRLIMIEQDGWNKEKDQWVRDYLQEHGFETMKTNYDNPHGNEMYVNAKFADVKARRQVLPVQC